MVDTDPGVVVTQVAAGSAHSLALTTTGQVLAWGANGFGQLGDGTNDSDVVPVEVSQPGGLTVSAIAAGSVHSLAVTATGQVIAWGAAGNGQLGNGNPVSRNVPVPSSLPAQTTVTDIAGGGAHSLATVG
ncbi:hypothetical protein [Natronosporangium hydrolyticum]|uniref:RCC1 domain-containing protein n=1 Tax=Natronosporangium hydrolyticum TaxID=2811111 RepID=UPI0030843F61